VGVAELGMDIEAVSIEFPRPNYYQRVHVCSVLGTSWLGEGCQHHALRQDSAGDHMNMIVALDLSRVKAVAYRSDISMHCLQREGWDADGNILRSLRVRRAVTHPLSGADRTSLPRRYLINSVAGLHSQGSAEDDRVFIKLRRLAWFGRWDCWGSSLPKSEIVTFDSG
jgi:hypothetical protein